MTVILNAHFDGRKIVLDDDYSLAPETRLLVTVIDEPGEEDLSAERQSWSELGKRALGRAYGEDEPEYSIEDAVE